MVLDLSASMTKNGDNVTPMVTAANSAIKKLLELNPNNRVAVVAYSGNTVNGSSEKSTAEVILPMGRYTLGVNSNNQPAYLVSSWRQNNAYNGIAYDTSKYLVTIVVSDNGDGTLSVSAPAYNLIGEDGKSSTASVNASFKNTYSASAENGVVFKGTKILTGKALEDDMFSFELYEASVSGETVTIGSFIESAKNKDGAFSFTEIDYPDLSKVGTHYYLIKEYIPDEKEVGMTYDETCYLVTITVSDNGDGTLAVSEPTYTVLDEEGNITENTKDNAIFNNSFETPEPPGEINPGTGVNNSLLWFACSLVVATGTVIFALPKKKEEQE